MRSWFILLTISAAVACAPSPLSNRRAASPHASATTTITIIGTSDLHGHIDHLPEFAGYVNNVRKTRAKDGAVVLIDAGDMFQGTIESNQGEGASVVNAYNALRYTAAAIGNHEFDYGPVGDVDPRAAGVDTRGALKARAAEATFPFLSANVTEHGTNIGWPNVTPSILVQPGGINVGIIGVTSIDTPHTTAKVNFAGLDVRPLLESVTAQAQALRKRGASIVIVSAHAGGACKSQKDPESLESCEAHSEIFKLAQQLEVGLVDAIVAGHTHQAIAHKVFGIPIIESFARGQAFGRIDLTLNTKTKEVTLSHVYRPQSICKRHGGSDDRTEGTNDNATCITTPYEGADVAPDPAVAAIVSDALARASKKRNEELNVSAPEELKAGYGNESPLGNLLADLIRDTTPGADLGVMNGGGIRSHLPSGKLLYGQLYEIMPFDNRLVTLRLPARAVKQMVLRSLKSTKGIVSISTFEAIAKCDGSKLEVELRARAGETIKDDAMLTIVTSDYLAEDGDGMFGKLPDGAVVDDRGPIMREAVIEALKKRGSDVGPSKTYFDPKHPRLVFMGRRPVQCP